MKSPTSQCPPSPGVNSIEIIVCALTLVKHDAIVTEFEHNLYLGIISVNFELEHICSMGSTSCVRFNFRQEGPIVIKFAQIAYLVQISVKFELEHL